MNNEYAVGIDLGGTRVKLGVVAAGELVAKRILPAQAAAGLGSFLPVLKREIDALIAELPEPEGSASRLSGIGMAFPGLTNHKTKKILSTNAKYDDAPELDLENWVRKEWDVPFALDNDARMATVGEWKFGAATDTDDLVVMTIGTGIGSSAVMEGNLLRGRHFQAGCLGGHFSVNYKGRQCSCGNVGCLEAYGATWSLDQTIREHAGFETSAFKEADCLDFKCLFQEAIKGDATAIAIREDILDIWASGIVSLIHAYDPEVVVIGGGVMHSADQIIPFLQQRVDRLAWTPWGKVELRPTRLADDAGILGIVYTLNHHI